MTNKKRCGDVAELQVASHLTKEGWQVLFPYGEYCRYDIVAEKHGRFIKVQVKYVTPKNGTLTINCKSSNNWSVKPYTKEEIDCIVAYDSLSEEIYFIDVKDIKKSELRLRLGPTRNNQKVGVRLADDYKNIPF
ncbi:MAG: group I intron-associated PD-(D/E)XK endonuclease [Patescibacteria group bacterium]